MTHPQLELEALLNAGELESDESDMETGDEEELAALGELEGDENVPADENFQSGEALDDEEVYGYGSGDALAYELMTVSDDAEMEEFLGKLMSSVTRKFKKMRRAVLPRLLPILRGPAGDLLKRAMPLLGSALGSAVPGAGTLLGGMAGRRLGQLLGGQMEDASDDEARVDLSRKLVSTVTDAVDRAVQDPRSGAEPVSAARDAFVGAMQDNLPAGVRRALARRKHSGAEAQSGRWVRRGRKIIVLGL
ncbi:hypothetical protein QTI24_06900 [Variovorax sp. J22P240]|uniref:hypothetical protein n=1 Tax=Variovorax sp. J22P240 TaxID=3053514 RepID=UPI002575BA4A|nr:hypothetical protein [Variovorax sp. J22P240]MDL9998319.1 hypothetical protein [Variovorax sp. J22P240]